MKNIFPFLLAMLLIVSCGDDDDVNNNDDNNNTQLSTPLLLVPANNSSEEISEFSSILFEWSEVANATQYLIEVSDDANFNNIVVSLTSNINERFINFSDNDDGTYFWRVRATGPGFEPSNYSETFNFNFTNNSGGGGGGGVTCDFCNRTFNGIYEITFSDDSNGPYNFSNKAMSFSVNNPNPSTSLYNTSFDFGFTTSENGISYSPSITATLSGNTLTYTNRTTQFGSFNNIGQVLINETAIVNGSITFSDNNTTASGTLNLSGGVTGTITFSATL